jgi:hypothetical protein
VVVDTSHQGGFSKESVVIDHEFGDVVHELFLVILFSKFDPVEFIGLALPEIAYHRIPLLLFLDDVHQFFLACTYL